MTVAALFGKPGVEVRVSRFVPETVGPTPEEMAPIRRARRGGQRTDFGRHFVSAAFEAGCSRPAPMPRPGFYMVGGVIHVHPNTWERLQRALPNDGRETARKDHPIREPW